MKIKKKEVYVCKDGTKLPAKIIVRWDYDHRYVDCFFSAREAAEKLGISINTVYNQISGTSRQTRCSRKIEGYLTLEETSKFCD